MQQVVRVTGTLDEAEDIPRHLRVAAITDVDRDVGKDYVRSPFDQSPEGVGQDSPAHVEPAVRIVALKREAQTLSVQRRIVRTPHDGFITGLGRAQNGHNSNAYRGVPGRSPETRPHGGIKDALRRPEADRRVGPFTGNFHAHQNATFFKTGEFLTMPVQTP